MGESHRGLVQVQERSSNTYNMNEENELDAMWLLSQLPALCITTGSILVERTLRRESYRDRCYAQIWMWLAATISLSLPPLASETGGSDSHIFHMMSLQQLQQQRGAQSGWSSLLFLSSLLYIFTEAQRQQDLLVRIRQRQRQQRHGAQFSFLQRLSAHLSERLLRVYKFVLPYVSFSAWLAHAVTVIFLGKVMGSIYVFFVTWLALVSYRYYRQRQRQLRQGPRGDAVFRPTYAPSGQLPPLNEAMNTNTTASTAGTASQGQPIPASEPVSSSTFGISTAPSVSPSASSLPMSSPQSASSMFFASSDEDYARWYSWSPTRVLQWVSEVFSAPNTPFNEYDRTRISVNRNELLEEDDESFNDDWIPFFGGSGASKSDATIGEEIVLVLAPQRLPGRLLDTLTATRLHQEFNVPYGPACQLADSINDLVIRYPKPRSTRVAGASPVIYRREPFTSACLQVNSSSSGATDEEDYDNARSNYLAQYNAKYNSGAVRRSVHGQKPAPRGSEPTVLGTPESHQRTQQMMHDRYGLSLPRQIPIYGGVPGPGAVMSSRSSTSDSSPNPASTSGSSHQPPPVRHPYHEVPVVKDVSLPHARDSLLSMKQEVTSGEQVPELKGFSPAVLQQMPPHIRAIAVRNPDLVRQMLTKRQLPRPIAELDSDKDGEISEEEDDEMTNLLGKSLPSSPRYHSME